MEEKGCMFKKSKMYTDHGSGSFTNKEILSICLLGIMHDIGAPLKTYGRIVALFKDVIMEQEAITTTFRHWHTAINHLSQQFCMKGLYSIVMTQRSPLINCFYPVPVHNAQAMIESLLYLLLVKGNTNFLFPTPMKRWLYHPLKFRTLLTSTLAMSTARPTRIYTHVQTMSSVESSTTLTN
jgi:hypothetical protein